MICVILALAIALNNYDEEEVKAAKEDAARKMFKPSYTPFAQLVGGHREYIGREVNGESPMSPSPSVLLTFYYCLYPKRTWHGRNKRSLAEELPRECKSARML